MAPTGLEEVVEAVERVARALRDRGVRAPAERLDPDSLRVVYRLLFAELARRRGGDVRPVDAVASLDLATVPAPLLDEHVLEDATGLIAGIETPTEPVEALGALHEALLEHAPAARDGRLRRQAARSQSRKAAGAFFTPTSLVDWVLDLTLEPTLDEDRTGVSVLDPSCGAGVFLVGAVRRLRHRGVPGARAVALVAGVDRDPAALELARVCLWLELVEPDRSVAMPALALSVDDALLGDRWRSRAPVREFDVVVGNPPFLNQLERLTTHPPGVAARLDEQSAGTLRPYTDVSAVFLQRAVGWVRDGGRVGLVQPQSLLAARDAAGVRGYVAEHCALEALWASDVPVFDAAVLTCAPVLRRGGAQGPVRRFHGPAFEEVAPRAEPRLDGAWSYLLGSGLGIPEVVLPGDCGILSDVAECTADFRDQYYGLAPYVHEAAAAPTTDVAPLVTSGLVDPALSRWGSTPTRFLKRRWEAPVIDLEGLREDERLHRWARRRLVPKVLVGTQGKVVEAVADEDGLWLPSVPTITVVPAEGRLWHVLAVLLAPPVAAHAAAEFAGTALSMRAIKLSAKQVGELPLPGHHRHWDAGAAAVRCAQHQPSRRREHLAEAARHMCRAYGTGDEPLEWWLARV